MKRGLIYFLFFLIWSGLCVYYGLTEGKNRAEKQTLIKTITVYKEKEKNTLEQEKTAEKIKVVYRELKSDEKDCDFVLNFDVSKCLPKSSK